MKFYGLGVVWDSGSSKVLCRFENGEFETEDKIIIKKLINLGYENDGVIEEEIEIEDKIDLTEKTVADLREMAKLAGFTGIYSKTKDELISMIEGD